MDRPSIDDRLDELAPLAEPIRRALYLHVAARPEATGRDAAAEAVGIGRALAAFHLDRLVEAGLLVADYRRLSGRSGPGAGRPAKVYRRADRDVEVSLPERRDDIVARLFATALEADRDGTAPGGVALERAARAYGRTMGREAKRRAGPRPTRPRRLESASAVLADQGFEPIAEGSSIALGNCPFDRVARDHRDLVCGMNRSLMEGVVSGLGSTGIAARFDPQPGRCCVVLDG
jgi:predicted ArsR family transcriptional regulator